jgi:hypothetical protein
MNEDLARRLEAHYAQTREDLPFCIEVARVFGGPILELGCAAGELFH